MVTRIGDYFFASSALCTHEEADLTLGILNGDVITCPLHGAKFEIRTGKVLEGPNGTGPDRIHSLKTYVIQASEDELWIDL